MPVDLQQIDLSSFESATGKIILIQRQPQIAYNEINRDHAASFERTRAGAKGERVYETCLGVFILFL